MKRFVTYLYEYEGGHKTKNTGFIRVDIRNCNVNLEVCVRNLIHSLGIGKLYGFVEEEGLLGIELGEVKVINGQSDTRLSLPKNNLNESGYSIEELYGMGICFPNQKYLASCWKDEIAEQIGRNEFSVFKKEDREMQAAEIEEEAALEEIEDVENMDEVDNLAELHIEETKQIDRYTTYEKMELNEIRNLESENWHLCNNSFLVHGFFNYGYLILKKEVEAEKENFSLGVPGFFEKPELVMAMVYGFSNFEAVPQEIIEMPMHVESTPYEIEKNQRPETGIFGGWFTSLQN